MDEKNPRSNWCSCVFISNKVIARNGMARSIRLSRIVAQANQIAAELQELHFGSLHLPGVVWRPAMNVYLHADRFVVCVELAGMPKQDIAVEVETRRLVIRGNRLLPEPDCAQPPCGRVLVMEIAEGMFERVVEFPREIAPDQVEARQENGWLWITLPLAS
jgi:HSP20 family molecular chaperone IbpA